MEIILIVFLKKSLWQFGHFGPKMVRSHNFGSALSFFLILYNKRGQEVHEIVLVFFREKFHLGQLYLLRPMFYCLIGRGQN